MKVFLLNPLWNFDNPKDFDVLRAPYGLASISAYLKKFGKDVTLWDPQPFFKNRNEIISTITQKKPDIVGMTAYTYNINDVAYFLAQLKKSLPDVKTVIGGPHITGEPILTLQRFPVIDYGIIGEGELPLNQLINYLSSDQDVSGIDALVYRDNQGKVVANRKLQLLNNLDDIPFADWESLPMDKYWDSLTTEKKYGVIFASRGCPHSCIFCAAGVALGKKSRKRSPQNFVSELAYLGDKYGITEFNFLDSTFTIDKKWVMEICDEILKLKHAIKFKCTTRANNADIEMYQHMKKAGCTTLLLGVDSCDSKILKSSRKGMSCEQIENAISIIEKVGISIDASFIIGLPEETKETINRSIKLAKRIMKKNNSMAAFTMATPFPGTEFYDLALKEGFPVQEWGKYDYFHISYVPKSMTKKDLEDSYKEILKEVYYLNYSLILNRALQIRSFRQLKLNIRYFFRMIFRRLNILKLKTPKQSLLENN